MCFAEATNEMKFSKLRKQLLQKSHVPLLFWFVTGVLLGLFFLISFAFIGFKHVYAEKIYPGVRVAGVEFGGKTKEDVERFFESKNATFAETAFIFSYNDLFVPISAEELQFGFDSELLADQAYSLGRSGNIFSDIGILFLANQGDVNLSSSYRFTQDVLEEKLSKIAISIAKEPVEALFTFQDGRVTAFQLSADGQELDWSKLLFDLQKKRALLSLGRSYTQIDIPVPVKTIKPKVSTSDINSFGIHELIGSGSSRFTGSIPNRIHNVALGASKMNGVLVAPGETFSFNKVLGDVSKFTGYKEAYVIKDGRTVLGDGGGVCQVSTTLFRAILNSGLPILERHPHSYRVSYYEQDLGPGFDATVYDPGYDLKFRNDTEHHILIQAMTDPVNATLRFDLYGTGDGREVTVSKATVTNQQPAPPDLYQDDPTLPKGQVKQVDFKATGADVTFSREVTRKGTVLHSDNFRSRYRPWQAVFLRGTKE